MPANHHPSQAALVFWGAAFLAIALFYATWRAAGAETPVATPTATEMPCEMKCGGTPACLDFCKEIHG